MDIRTYKLLDKIKASKWQDANDETIQGFIKCIQRAEEMANFLGTSLDCKNLIWAMERELRIRRRTLGVLEAQEAA